MSSYALFGHHGPAPANLEKLSQGQAWLPGLLDSIACCFASAEKVSPASHILEHTVPRSPSLRGLSVLRPCLPCLPCLVSLCLHTGCLRDREIQLGGPVTSGAVLEVGFPCLFLLPQGYQGCHLQAPPSSQNTSPTSQHCQKMLSTLAGLAATTVTDT